jgi:hypothetical protein
VGVRRGGSPATTDDLLERDGVAEPSQPIRYSVELPGEQHPAVGDHHRATLRTDHLLGFELRT